MKKKIRESEKEINTIEVRWLAHYKKLLRSLQNAFL